MTPQALESQMEFLVSKGYRAVTFTEAALEDHPGKVVSVTFGDAYDSVGQLARPILDRGGFPGTIYAPTRFMGTGKPKAWPGIDEWIGGPPRVGADADVLGSTAEAGWEIGSHTVSHGAYGARKELAATISG